MINLDGKVALVTGSTKGIGYAIALSLAEQGAQVIINSRSASDEIECLLEEVKKYKVTYMQADVTDDEAVNKMIKEILVKFGRIDILVNNAGGTEVSSIISMKNSSIDEMFLKNAKSAFFTVRAVMKTMIKQRYGRIINISSIAGIKGFAMQGHYAAAKAAVIGFTKSVAQEVGSKGITCNAVAPGAIKTSNMYSESMEEQAIQMTPLRRLGTPEDVAGVVTFLASDSAAFITGQVIQVDGGMRM